MTYGRGVGIVKSDFKFVTTVTRFERSKYYLKLN